MKTYFKTFTLSLLCAILGQSVMARTNANYPKIKNISVTQSQVSDYYSYRIVIIVKGDDNDEVAGMKVEIEPGDEKSPKPLYSSYTLQLDKNLSTKTEKYFYSTPCDLTAEKGVCLFDGKKSLLGLKYQVKATMYNAEGKTPWQWSGSTEILKIDKTDDPFCANNYAIDEFILETKGLGGTVTQMAAAIQYTGEWKVNQNSSFTNYFKIDAKDKSEIAKVLVNYITLDCDNKEVNNFTTATLNEKTGFYESTVKLSASEKCPLTILAINIGVVNPCEENTVLFVELDEVIGFGNGSVAFAAKKGLPGRSMTNINSAHENKDAKDSCDTKYDVKTVSYTTSNSGGIYTMSFGFKMTKNSDIPAKVEMAVSLTNCSGETTAMKITLTYDERTGYYTGGQAISQSKDCAWNFTFGEIAAYNECKDRMVWTYSHDERKGNGSGTKNASSQASTKPQLF